MTLPVWTERPVEQARLLNPAFVGALVWSMSRGYSAEDGRGLPFALTFLGVPVTLHKSTREQLPATTRTSLAAWLSDHPEALVGVADRARALVPVVKEAMIFAGSTRLLSVSDTRIQAGRRPKAMTSFDKRATDEVRLCVKKAGFVGKWFGRTRDSASVMAL